MFQTSFQQPDGTRPTREAFLTALASIDAILIRATYHTIMAFSKIQDISMDTAVLRNTGQDVASIVEQCDCPEGYTGLSCEVQYFSLFMIC